MANVHPAKRNPSASVDHGVSITFPRDRFLSPGAPRFRMCLFLFFDAPNFVIVSYNSA
jgi:hypothetical protein